MTASRLSGSRPTTLGWGFSTRTMTALRLHLLGLFGYWPSWHVLLNRPKDELNPHVFPLAILIARSMRFALAPLYLGSLYIGWVCSKLNQCSGSIRCCHADFRFLQVFIWERFSPIVPKHIVPTVVIEEVTHMDGSRKWRHHTHQTLGMVVAKCKSPASKSLMKVLNKEENTCCCIRNPTPIKECLLPQHFERPTRSLWWSRERLVGTRC